jgi:hypothetical protein
MAAFSTLTPQQQALVSGWLTATFRPTVLANARALAALQQMATFYAAAIAPLLATVDAAETIPDQTGLAGAAPLAVADVTQWMTAAEAVLTAQNTPAQVAEFVKIAGVSVGG